MIKLVLSIFVLSAVFPLFANAGQRLQAESKCASADGKFSGHYKVTETGSSFEAGPDVIDLKLTNNHTGKRYSCTDNKDELYRYCDNYEYVAYARSGQHIFVGIKLSKLRTEAATLFCPELPEEDGIANPAVPNLVLHLESKTIDSIKWETWQQGYDTMVGAKFGACTLETSTWKKITEAPKRAFEPVTLVQTIADQESYRFMGTTPTHLYSVICSVSGPDVKSSILKAFPAGMVSFTTER